MIQIVDVFRPGLTTFFASVNFSRRALNYKAFPKMITAGISGQLFLEILAVSGRFNKTVSIIDSGIPFSTRKRGMLLSMLKSLNITYLRANRLCSIVS